MDFIREKLKAAVRKLYGVECEPEVGVAPANVEADYASNVPLKLAKVARKNPMEIAGELAEGLEGVSASAAAPGFINFILPDEYYMAKIGDFAADFDKNISQNEYLGKTVICEFSDPNPFKVLHVGHLYTSVVGDAISRLYEHAGARVVRANFGGDVGLHVAKTMYALQRRGLAELAIDDIAKCYVEGTALYEEDEQARAEITRINKEIYRINSEKVHGEELADLYWRGRELSYEYFRDFYARIGVEFDKYYPESTVADLGVAKVEEGLARGVYEMSEGAVVFDGEKYGLHTRVFINREGVPTYEAKDVGLIFTKWEDYRFDKSVVITGGEQLDYMKVVLKSVEQYASELVERTAHLTHGLVKLKGGVKMSSRKGNFLKAVEVLELVKEALAAERGGVADERVALAATKYAFIKYKMGGDIIFDPEESVRMTGNSGVYLLYSCVRAKKVLLKERSAEYSFPEQTDLTSERHTLGSRENRPAGEPLGAGRNIRSEAKQSGTVPKEECLASRALAKKILQYTDVLGEAVREMAPHKVAGYLYEVAQEFSRFYERCPVNGSAEEAQRRELVEVYLEVMTHGLGLLGITEIPEEM